MCVCAVTASSSERQFFRDRYGFDVTPRVRDVTPKIGATLSCTLYTRKIYVELLCEGWYGFDVTLEHMT